MHRSPPAHRTLLTRLDDRFGTWRGLVRLCLAWSELAAGRLRPFDQPALARVERLVWVCAGNVCRSPYAHQLARELRVPSASFGLSTVTGQAACADAIAAAARVGADLTAHRATAWEDFSPRETDLYVVMEIRQARELRRRLGDCPAPITLLGLWGRPRRPHIHDPMTLSPAYFDTCLRVIERSVSGLVQSWRQAGHNGIQGPQRRVRANQRSEKKGSGSPTSNTKYRVRGSK